MFDNDTESEDQDVEIDEETESANTERYQGEDKTENLDVSEELGRLTEMKEDN